MGKAHDAMASPKKAAPPATMSGPALAFAMTAAQKITPDTLGSILTKATESDKGSEYTRLWQATSWKDILWSGIGVLGTSIWNAGQTTKFLTDRQSFINEVMNDPGLPQFIEENKPLMSCLLRHVLSENAKQAAHPSRSIDAFVEELPALVSQLQQRGCLKNVKDIDAMVHTIFDTLIQDAASLSANTKEQNLFNASLSVSSKFLEMTAAHPITARNIIGRFATSSKSPSYQNDMVKALTKLGPAKTTKKIGLDGKHRNDLADLCTKYREETDVNKRMFLDTPVEAAIHRYDFSDLTMDANTIAKDMHIEGFTFKAAKLMSDFPSSGSYFTKCDFSFATLANDISFKNCTMDADTFKTLLPSLRVAKAEGKKVELGGMTLVGDTSQLDLSYIDIKGIRHYPAPQTREDAVLPAILSENTPPKPDTPPLSRREIIHRKAIETFSNNVWISLSPPVRQALIKQTPSQGMVDPGHTARAKNRFARTLESMYGSISKLSTKEQKVIVYTLVNNQSQKNLQQN